ncbi:MAG: hypothetical protein ACRDGM_16305, partial [bacterium]
LLLLAIGALTVGVRAETFVIEVVRIPFRVIEVVTVTKEVSGRAVSATPEQEAQGTIELAAISLLLVLCWRIWGRYWRRTIVFLLAGFGSNAMVPGLAIPTLFLISALLAKYDEYLEVRPRTIVAPQVNGRGDR